MYQCNVPVMCSAGMVSGIELSNWSSLKSAITAMVTQTQSSDLELLEPVGCNCLRDHSHCSDGGSIPGGSFASPTVLCCNVLMELMN